MSALAIKPLLSRVIPDHSSSQSTSGIAYVLFHVLWLYPLSAAALYYSGVFRAKEELGGRGGSGFRTDRGVTASIVAEVSVFWSEGDAGEEELTHVSRAIASLRLRTISLPSTSFAGSRSSEGRSLSCTHASWTAIIASSNSDLSPPRISLLTSLL